MKFPDYIIIGSTRCGTTSFYNYISAHPKAKRAIGTQFREVHFFDYARNYRHGIKWYKNQFAKVQITGETSPTYLQHPLVPQRIKLHSPNTKFVVMLRNPVNRAYSDYWLACRKGWTSEKFKVRITKESQDIASERGISFWENDFLMSETHLLGFLERGKYAEQIEGWFKIFPREQFYIIKSESFYNKPDKTLQNVYGFLGLKPFSLSQYRAWNNGRYPSMADKTRRKLSAFFKPYNQQLESLLGRQFKWS